MTLGYKHPLTPPPDLVEDWIEIAKPLPQRPPNPGVLAELATQWGADLELEACCAQLSQCYLLTSDQGVAIAEYLHSCRRPLKAAEAKA
jgi:hypothetical protein